MHYSDISCSIRGAVPNTPASPENIVAHNMPTVPPIAGVSTSVTGFIGFSPAGPVQTAVPINSFAQYQAQFGGLAAGSEMGFAVNQFFENGGSNCSIVRVGASGPLDLAEARTALAALDAVGNLNLLCLPGVSDAAILAAARTYCEKRRTFLIIDADPNATTAAALTNLMNGPALPRSISAAVYAPWLEIPNPLTNSGTLSIPPSGTVAGIYAATDANSGVWKAPAGLHAALQGVSGLAVSVTDAEGAALGELGMNLIRRFPAAGMVVWGARTLGPLAGGAGGGYQYVPVRRLALYIEASIIAGTRWAVFEPNGPALWAHVQSLVTAFLQQLYLQGAFQGSTPAEAYFVKCDATTMTQAEIDQGILNIVVGFAALRPAEFVVLQIQ